jgi:hypothetical protein
MPIGVNKSDKLPEGLGYFFQISSVNNLFLMSRMELA